VTPKSASVSAEIMQYDTGYATVSTLGAAPGPNALATASRKVVA
jgi:hypothetical protein